MTAASIRISARMQQLLPLCRGLRLQYDRLDSIGGADDVITFTDRELIESALMCYVGYLKSDIERIQAEDLS